MASRLRLWSEDFFRTHGKTVLGINYSGQHDTSAALVRVDGQVLFACSLERLTRVKQDGRPPSPLLEGIDWSKISAVAVSTDERFEQSPAGNKSLLHPVPLADARPKYRGEHAPAFYEILDALPAPKHYVCHQISHAASAFFISGFEEASCLTYDAGMSNCAFFGGLYDANYSDGIVARDRFAASGYAKITLLYSFVTALLGFSANKHEGKITGLAAYGKHDPRCARELEDILANKYAELEALFRWHFSYSGTIAPFNVVDFAGRSKLGKRLLEFEPATLAATLQCLTEEHVLTILANARKHGLLRKNICLAGGLFANVKVNQRIHEFGFERVFVAPPMTDDGSALGAALMVAWSQSKFKPRALKNVFWGPGFSGDEITSTLEDSDVRFTRCEDAPKVLAAELARGKIVAVFQGRAEFGPRALGNRSILCEAKDARVNELLNVKLRRTEFMPFAPITRMEDASKCYTALEGAELTAQFMTITLNATDELRKTSPAVVHCDGTARPQLVTLESNALLYNILTEYKHVTGITTLVNTSFNIHEEPMVCSPEDAIRGFFQSGIDLLYFEDGILVSQDDNHTAAARYLRAASATRSEKEHQHAAALEEYSAQLFSANTQLSEKEKQIRLLAEAAAARLSALEVVHAEMERMRERNP
jgi:carbamoyltransferase